MDVSIIYVNYKTCDLLLNSIQSVREHTSGISYEIIVVDNHSEDASRERLLEQYPEVTYIQSEANVGFGRANNLGIKAARGQCVLFLNPDTLLINDAISLLFHYSQAHADVGACGGNLYDEEGNPASSFGRRFPSFTQEFLSIFYIPAFRLPYYKSQFFNHTSRPLQVASIVGADLMVKKEVLNKVGGFDPVFFMNYEETELCHRIHTTGYKVYSVPEARITHLEGRASYIKQSRLFFLYEGQYIYFHKLYGEKGAKRIYELTQLRNNMRLFLFRLLGNQRKTDYWKMKSETNKEVFNRFITQLK